MSDLWLIAYGLLTIVKWAVPVCLIVWLAVTICPKFCPNLWAKFLHFIKFND